MSQIRHVQAARCNGALFTAQKPQGAPIKRELEKKSLQTDATLDSGEQIPAIASIGLGEKPPMGVVIRQNVQAGQNEAGN